MLQPASMLMFAAPNWLCTPETDITDDFSATCLISLLLHTPLAYRHL